MPAAAIVHGNLGKPLREIVAAPTTCLPTRDSGRARFPGKRDRNRVARRERHRQRHAHDRTVRGNRILDHQHGRSDFWRGREPLIREVLPAQLLKALTTLSLIGGRPTRSRAKRIQVLMHPQFAQCIRAAIHILERPGRANAPHPLIKRGNDRVVGSLLPVPRRVVAAGRRLRDRRNARRGGALTR